MDETDSPQTPPELLVILAALADEKIPMQTIAPKFTGRFNKGVDYVGDLAQFEKEFQQDLAVIAFAIDKYGLPANLKLSVHSGSDKFSIYAPIRRGLAKFDAGLHIKTAGTSWLEEVIGLAEAGGARARTGQGDLRQGAGQARGAVRTVCRGDRHRPGPIAVGRRSAELVERAIRLGAAARSGLPGFQPSSAAIDPRRLQDRGPNGRPLFARCSRAASRRSPRT